MVGHGNQYIKNTDLRPHHELGGKVTAVNGQLDELPDVPKARIVPRKVLEIKRNGQEAC